MENKEFQFGGTVVNGFLMLFLNIVLQLASLAVVISGMLNGPLWIIIPGVLLCLVSLICWAGFLMLEPNTARVTTWFGKYSGTFTRTGFFWINPFYSTKKLSLRARNLDA